MPLAYLCKRHPWLSGCRWAYFLPFFLAAISWLILSADASALSAVKAHSSQMPGCRAHSHGFTLVMKRLARIYLYQSGSVPVLPPVVRYLTISRRSSLSLGG